MIKSILLPRATFRVALPSLGVALLAFAWAVTPAFAFTPSGPKASGENAPLKLTTPSVGTHASSSGAGIVRTIVGLLIVIAVIWGLNWILRQVKSSRETQAGGTGLTSMATLPLGTGRSLHLVRAGQDYLLLGSAEQGVVPIYRYTEQQAREAGLLSADGPTDGPDGGAGVIRSAAPFGSSGPLGAILDRLRLMTVRQ